MQLSVDKYKEHPLFPFSDFRENDASFLMLELFWTQVTREAIGEELYSKVELLQQCERDIDRYYSPLMLRFWIPEVQRIVKILLSENFDNSLEISTAKGDDRFNAYIPFSFYLEYSGVSHVNEKYEAILINSDMSNTAVNSVQNVLRTFLVSKVTMDEMEREWEFYKKNNGIPSNDELDDYYNRIYPDDVDE